MAIYAFISGYALERLSSGKIKKELSLEYDYKLVARQACKFIRRYWIAFVFVITFRIVFSKETFSIGQIAKGFIAKTPAEIEGGWWYVSFYLSVLLAFPLLNTIFHQCKDKKENAKNQIVTIVLSGVIFIWIMLFMNRQLVYITIFLIAYFISAYKVYEKVYEKLSEWPKVLQILFNIVVFVLCVGIRVAVSNSIDYTMIDVLIIAPFIYSGSSIVANITLLRQILSFFGKYSVYIWLTHNAVQRYYFDIFTYASRSSIVMYFSQLCAVTVIAIALSLIEAIIEKVCINIKERCLKLYE
ncbi:MAG: hypothetical protein LUH07_03970 [Lachnospiraceae bacterium]|nr:hypothetical protein [Lachnospiraceae bacterium]